MTSFKKHTIGFITVLILLSTIAVAQFFNEAMSSEALRPFWDVNGIGASSFSLHNNSLISRDISTTLENPAFLTNIRRPKAGISMCNITVDQQTTLAGNNREFGASSNALQPDYVGFAYPVPVYQGNMVLAVSYAPSAYYYTTLSSKGLVSKEFGDIYQEADIEETGALNTLRLAGAVEFIKNFNLGLSLNFYDGNRTYKSTETAIDTNDVTFEDRIQYQQVIKPNYSGFNMDVGLSYQSTNFKFGLRLSAPLNMTIHEISESSEIYTSDSGIDSTAEDYYDFEYKSRYPLEVAPSLAITVRNLTIGLELVIHNWQKIEVDQLTDKADINRDLYWNLRRTTDIGVSAALPIGRSISTRFAYRRIQSPYENPDPDDEYFHLFGAGIETIIKKSFILGCAYQRATGNQTISHSYFDTFSAQKYQEDRLTVSMAVLF
ncbi:hypothetical protein KJ656_10175 [bacterium]|nr:hypothetical protein [bacterium]